MLWYRESTYRMCQRFALKTGLPLKDQFGTTSNVFLNGKSLNATGILNIAYERYTAMSYRTNHRFFFVVVAPMWAEMNRADSNKRCALTALFNAEKDSVVNEMGVSSFE